MSDHVHMLISVPPKHSVSYVAGYIKGKSAIHIAREFGGVKNGFRGVAFWARGYYVSTVGADAQTVREYIRHQAASNRMPAWPARAKRSDVQATGFAGGT